MKKLLLTLFFLPCICFGSIHFYRVNTGKFYRILPNTYSCFYEGLTGKDVNHPLPIHIYYRDASCNDQYGSDYKCYATRTYEYMQHYTVYLYMNHKPIAQSDNIELPSRNSDVKDIEMRVTFSQAVGQMEYTQKWLKKVAFNNGIRKLESFSLCIFFDTNFSHNPAKNGFFPIDPQLSAKAIDWIV